MTGLAGKLQAQAAGGDIFSVQLEAFFAVVIVYKV